MDNTTIYALDFDGVLCDSALETAMTGWKAASTLWDDMPNTAPVGLTEKFRLIRPLIETGYEAILAMRLLYRDVPVEKFYSHYDENIQALLKGRNISVAELKQLFGATRDAWIADDLNGWIAMNPLFSGIAAKLQRLSQHHAWYIITTKQERFVKHILQAHGIELADARIFGLDRNKSKVDVLRELVTEHAPTQICFVEDRLATLLNVLKCGELSSVKLIFALWGYNTAEDKTLAAQHPLSLQNLTNFLE